VNALPAGTNNIGDVDVATLPALPAGNNNIGDIDVLSVVPGTGATNLGKAEDAVHTSGDTGVMALAVRSDAGGSLVSASGDYSPLQVDATGNLRVSAEASTITDDAAFTVGTSRVFPAGHLADEVATDSVGEGDIGAPRMTLDRKTIVSNQPHNAGGCSIFRSIDLDETEEEVSATAATLYGWYIANTATATRFVKFYNATAAAVTVGTTTPVMTLPIPGNANDDVGANMLGGVGIAFGTALTVAATTGVADSDTGAPGANDVIVNLFFRA
ncbi:MAG: hypothetical protein MN733_09985, partial [Nitrososphaera sp.]|nr:hypothetical protein [Nitrososphaera sp.]